MFAFSTFSLLTRACDLALSHFSAAPGFVDSACRLGNKCRDFSDGLGSGGGNLNLNRFTCAHKPGPKQKLRGE